MSERLISQKILREAVEYGSKESGLEVYDLLQKALSKYRFKYFITITSSKPLTDYIAVVEINRRIKQIVNRKLYGRREYLAADLKYIFFIEEHADSHRFQKKFHIHLIVTEPRKSRQEFEQFGEPKKEALMWKVFHETIKKIKCIKPFWAIVDPNETAGKKPPSNGTQKHFCIEQIRDQEGIVDYLLKTLRRGPEDIMEMIDVENSDLNFRYD